MLSDLSYSTLPFDMPTPPEEDPLTPLNFDDILDIAHEFEFTRTITHIWPCEEEPTTFPEMGLEDILATIVPTPKAEDSPLPLSCSTMSMTPDLVHVQEVDLHGSASMCPVPDRNIYREPVHLPKDDDQVRAGMEPPITSMLRGWSPPNGSQFLDLDDSLMLPQSLRDVWTPPWLATFIAPSYTQPASSTNQVPAMVPAISDMHPQIPVTEPKVPPVSMIDKTVDDPIKKSVPFVSLPVQSSARAILEPVQARSTLQTNSNVSSQTAMIVHTKTPKSRPRPLSTPVAGGASTTRYAKAPRGGIPPHIARTVTKANILLVEKERKVMRDAFSSTTTAEKKKPSVLRRATKVEGGSSGKKPFACGENEEKKGRGTKKARV